MECMISSDFTMSILSFSKNGITGALRFFQQTNPGKKYPGNDHRSPPLKCDRFPGWGNGLMVTTGAPLSPLSRYWLMATRISVFTHQLSDRQFISLSHYLEGFSTIQPVVVWDF